MCYTYIYIYIYIYTYTYTYTDRMACHNLLSIPRQQMILSGSLAWGTRVLFITGIDSSISMMSMPIVSMLITMFSIIIIISIHMIVIILLTGLPSPASSRSSGCRWSGLV